MATNPQVEIKPHLKLPRRRYGRKLAPFGTHPTDANWEIFQEEGSNVKTLIPKDAVLVEDIIIPVVSPPAPPPVLCSRCKEEIREEKCDQSTNTELEMDAIPAKSRNDVRTNPKPVFSVGSSDESSLDTLEKDPKDMTIQEMIANDMADLAETLSMPSTSFEPICARFPKPKISREVISKVIKRHGIELTEDKVSKKAKQEYDSDSLSNFEF